LDIFCDDYDLENHFKNNIQTTLTEKTYPILSGQLFVNNANGQAINELHLTNKYNSHWPDLIIRADKVEEAPAIKYVEIEASTGKEKQIDIKYSEDNKLVLTDKPAPSRVHFDFLGWSPDKPGTTDNPTFYVVLENNQWVLTPEGEADTIPSNTNTRILYAIFVPHAYSAIFDFDNGTSPMEITTTWEAGKLGLNKPTIYPYKPYPYGDNEMTPFNVKGLYRTYTFKGWAYAGDEE